MNKFLYSLILLIIANLLVAQNNPAPFIGTNLTRGTQLRDLRLAVSCTGEYTQSVGGVANAQAYINTWIDELNATYGREYCVRFTLIPNNDILVFGDPNTDPWPTLPANASPCNGDGALYNAQAGEIDTRIGAANYDISHIFMLYPNSGGGCAGYFKGGISGPPNIAITRHEIGHQFSQSHTISNGGNNNYELSGGNWSIQGGNQQPYAHSSSFHSLANHLLTTEANAGTKINTGNTIPTVSAGPDRAIPISTPFVMKATANDPDNGDILTYAWDQLDRGIQQASPVPDDSQGPLFMRFAPTTEASRTIPKIADVIANNYRTTQESLPTQARDMNIRVTVNDNHKYDLNGTMINASGINSDDIKVTVVNTGPFAVTAPNAGTETWTTGQNVTVNWSEAGTRNAPISCAVVDIMLSTDGGVTYPYTLADGTTNDGTHTFILPNSIPATGQARIRVECDSYENLRFFDISNQDFTINSVCAVIGHVITPTSSITVDPGDAGLDLNPTPAYAKVLNDFTVNVVANDPMGRPAEFMQNGTGCTVTGFNLPYKIQSVKVDRTGEYTINPRFVGGLFEGFMVLYDGTYNPTSSCTNFVASNTTAGPSQTENIVVNLTAGTTYNMVFFPWVDATATTCNVSLSSSIGGKFYDANTQTAPAGGYAYTYAAVNTANGSIVQVSNDANFTTLPSGNYQVYGVSYKSANAPPDIVNPANFVGQTVGQIVSANCANFSSNYTSITVTGDPGGGGGEVCTDYPATDVPENIVDNTTVSSTLNVAAMGTISDLNITLTGTHTYMEDLTVTLVSPNNTRVVLFTAQCEDMDNFSITLDDEAANAIDCPVNDAATEQPQNVLASFDGQEMNGTWTLEISDNATDDTGQLTSWSLNICTGGNAGGVCEAGHNLTGTIAAGIYRSQQNITATGTVANGSNVMLKAGNSITLNGGFTVQAGATFSAAIEACIPLLPPAISYRSEKKKDHFAEMKLFPNPATEMLTVQLGSEREEVDYLVIYDNLGQTIYTINIEEGQEQLQIDLQQSVFRTGVYLVALHTAQGYQTKRLVVTKNN
ncbi:MAG: reprolysin-like metallopeptidase [Saprospiraceae bacterium]